MLYRLLAVVLVCWTLAACSSSPEPPPEPLRLRVLSYNIHHGRGADGVINLERLAEVIKRADPDLVALQEVDRKTRRSGGVDQAAKLGELTGMHHYFAQAMPFQGGGYGEAILSKAKDYIADAETISLPAEPGQEPRALAIGDFKPWSEGKPSVPFGGTHLCHQSAETRLAQVHQINEDLLMAPRPIYILVGDFNFKPSSAAYKAMIEAGWVDTATVLGDAKPTYPADQPTKRIDYVFVQSPNLWRVINVLVLDEPIASDHAPVLVELEYIIPD